MSDYVLSEDPALIDLDRVFHWLSEDGYWALGRSREAVELSFAHSYPVGIHLRGTQVAVARIVSDLATHAWFCDVYVDPEHRGRGLGQQLARWAVDWIDARGIARILLATRDAHDVYASAGFHALNVPERWMEIDRRPANLVALPT